MLTNGFQTDPEKEVRKGADSELIDETEYDSMVAEFDLLWGRTTTPQEQSRMERMIRLIDAFENSRNSQNGHRQN
ncbi:hypothetical protein SAMN04515620_15121 [Collimonas sp. OK607]|uniref:hypothetical protein n=1 Tax=Collimonas sp. OK607 TaxID=1798194 RepID=UPI0008F0FC75|nr:hypothetical protein [Collimonas sp. OK607]SFB36228.1 hypothetical protein SAMN04515620_15121 [Collimonas sp. OK607]